MKLGRRQGCTSSLLLFMIVMEENKKNKKSRGRCKSRERFIEYIAICG